jgi:hypothetical protein
MTDEMDDALADRIYRARLGGISARSIREQFNCTVADVNAAVDRKMIQVDNRYRVRMTAIDLERLEMLTSRCIDAIVKGSFAAGHLLLKVMERRAKILGTDAPLRIDPIEIAAPSETSTQELKRIFDEIRRERSGEPSSEPAPPSSTSLMY